MAGTPLSEIKLEDIDFAVVKECRDKRVLKKYLKLLEDDGGYFTDLLKACKNKLLEVAPKDYYHLYPRVATDDEVNDAIKDMLEWEEQVKQTDEVLKNSKKLQIWDDGSKVRAPVRGQEPTLVRPNVASKEREREQLKEQETLARDKMKMKDYYKAWDSVDVDALEEQMEKEEREAEEGRKRHFDDLREQQEEANASTPIQVNTGFADGIPEVHRRALAESEKEKGNEAFYSRDFEEADAYYSRSLNLCKDDPSIWANRALVRLKINKHKGALDDCDQALAIHPRYMKALHRKGKALHELHRYAEAVKYFQMALAESPDNTQINGDLMVSRRHLRHEDQVPDRPPQSFAPPPRVNAPSRTTVEEIIEDEEEPPPSKMPGYTRVVIEEETDSEDDDDADAPAAGKAAAPSPAAPAPSSPQGGSAPSASAGAGQQPRVYHKIAIVEESDSEDEEPPKATGAASLQSKASKSPTAASPLQTGAPAAAPSAAPAAATAAAAVAAAVEATDAAEGYLLNDLD